MSKTLCKVLIHLRLGPPPCRAGGRRHTRACTGIQLPARAGAGVFRSQCGNSEFIANPIGEQRINDESGRARRLSHLTPTARTRPFSGAMTQPGATL